MSALERARKARRLFESAALWEAEAFSNWLAARMCCANSSSREDLLVRAWDDLERAARDNQRAREMVKECRMKGRV